MMKDFDKIVFRNEFTSLAGKSYRSILTLAGIILITIIVLGISSGSLIDLRKRMDNPYTNWIDIPVTSSIRPDSILLFFKQQKVQEEFLIRNLGEHDVYFHKFISYDGRDTAIFKGTTVFPDESIVRSVLYEIPDNLIVLHDSLDSNPCGIIVTQEFLSKLGYKAPFNTIRKISLPIESYVLLIEIVAVVKELPSLNDFFCCPVLKNMLVEPFYETGFIKEETSNIFSVLVRIDENNYSDEALLDYFGSFKPTRITQLDDILITEGDLYSVKKIVFPLEAYPSQKELNEYIKTTGDKTSLVLLPYTEFYCNAEGFSGVSNVQHLAFHFNSLDKIRAFQTIMKNRFNVDVSMQQIESAENFLLVSTLTGIISYVLFAFAILSIGFYISSLVRTHLQKQISNLGTLKAFGIYNSRLILIYARIITFFCMLAIALAFIVSLVFQFLIHKSSLPLRINVLSPLVLVSLCVILATCILITLRTARSIIHHTPGDLIYNRI